MREKKSEATIKDKKKKKNHVWRAIIGLNKPNYPPKRDPENDKKTNVVVYHSKQNDVTVKLSIHVANTLLITT
jgi:hypothetical protein